jgi:hypothetical protein
MADIPRLQKLLDTVCKKYEDTQKQLKLEERISQLEQEKLQLEQQEKEIRNRKSQKEKEFRDANRQKATMGIVQLTEFLQNNIPSESSLIGIVSDAIESLCPEVAEKIPTCCVCKLQFGLDEILKAIGINIMEVEQVQNRIEFECRHEICARCFATMIYLDAQTENRRNPMAIQCPVCRQISSYQKVLMGCESDTIREIRIHSDNELSLSDITDEEF